MSQQPTDKAIIGCVLDGDHRAYALLVKRYQHLVFTLAVRILQNRELAEETAQDIFVKAYQALDTFRGESKFSTWLYKIAYHKILDAKARGKRFVTIKGEWEAGLSREFSPEDTWSHLMQEERRKLLGQILQQMEADDRAVLTLHYLQELSLKEVAEIIGLRPETVKVRLYRARKRMKALMGQHINGVLLKDYGI
jgi:RNA polymerase sigma-70 factor (ECF subfamily)